MAWVCYMGEFCGCLNRRGTSHPIVGGVGGMNKERWDGVALM